MLKKKKKKGGGQHLKKEKGSNIGSCPQVPVKPIHSYSCWAPIKCETKRNEINENETKQNQRNENEIKRNQREQNEINENKTK